LQAKHPPQSLSTSLSSTVKTLASLSYERCTKHCIAESQSFIGIHETVTATMSDSDCNDGATSNSEKRSATACKTRGRNAQAWARWNHSHRQHKPPWKRTRRSQQTGGSCHRDHHWRNDGLDAARLGNADVHEPALRGSGSGNAGFDRAGWGWRFLRRRSWVRWRYPRWDWPFDRITLPFDLRYDHHVARRSNSPDGSLCQGHSGVFEVELEVHRQHPTHTHNTLLHPLRPSSNPQLWFPSSRSHPSPSLFNNE